jgi:hypothetical protein
MVRSIGLAHSGDRNSASRSPSAVARAFVGEVDARLAARSMHPAVPGRREEEHRGGRRLRLPGSAVAGSPGAGRSLPGQATTDSATVFVRRRSYRDTNFLKRPTFPHDGSPVSFSSQGIPQTVLGPEPPDARALVTPWEGPRRVAAVSWRTGRASTVARLGELATTWRPAQRWSATARSRPPASVGLAGSGYVRWSTKPTGVPPRSTACAAAAAIGEVDEEERCDEFLHQLSPAGIVCRDEPE